MAVNSRTAINPEERGGSVKGTIIITRDAEGRKQAQDIRQAVFIFEQQVPEELEIDKWDTHPDTTHVLLVDEQGTPAGTARFRPYGNGIVKIERVAVLASRRQCGAGRVIMEAIEKAAVTAGYHMMKLGAQLQARPFYQRLGFQAQGDEYMDAGIEHIDMIKIIGGPAADSSR